MNYMNKEVFLNKSSGYSSLAGALGPYPAVLPTPPPTPSSTHHAPAYTRATNIPRAPCFWSIPLLPRTTKITWRAHKEPIVIPYAIQDAPSLGIWMSSFIDDTASVNVVLLGANDYVLDGTTTNKSMSLFLRWDVERSPAAGPEPQFVVKLERAPNDQITTTRLDLGMQVAKAVKRFWSTKPNCKVALHSQSQTSSDSIDLSAVRFEHLVLRKVWSRYEGVLEVEIAAWC
ncbi:hypothetical protein MD484_g8214, partial [Candolleomyces efflorescens]